MCVVEEVVVPRVFFNLELLAPEVHLLSCVDAREELLVGLGHVVQEIGRLPFGG